MNDNFCVPKDNISNVGISIYTGAGRIISNLKLPLPDEVKKVEPISIGLRIDSNKIMKVTAFMKNTPEIKINAELSNPWTHRINTPEDIAANKLWEKVSHLKKEKQHISEDTMIELALKERLRNNIDGALEILQRLENEGINTDNLNNSLGLCYDERGQKEKALIYFKKAAELNPKNSTLVANYGSQLIDIGKIDAGISQFEAIVINPDDYSPYYWLGIAYRRQENEDLARKEFTRARQILWELCRQNRSERFLRILKDIHMALGEYEEAERVKRQLQTIRNSQILEGSPDDLIAGPESGIWKESDIFEDEEA